MAAVNWILKLGTHRSPYLHSQPPTSPLDLPNHMAEWAYEMDRVLTVHMALRHSTAHSPQWSGVPGGGPSHRGPVLPLALAHSPWGIWALFNHRSLSVVLRHSSQEWYLCLSPEWQCLNPRMALQNQFLPETNWHFLHPVSFSLPDGKDVSGHSCIPGC